MQDEWQVKYSVWKEGSCIEDIRKSWIKRENGIGKKVKMKVEGRVVEGSLEKIEEDCRFVIREDEGQRVEVKEGDVYLGKDEKIRK